MMSGVYQSVYSLGLDVGKVDVVGSEESIVGWSEWKGSGVDGSVGGGDVSFGELGLGLYHSWLLVVELWGLYNCVQTSVWEDLLDLVNLWEDLVDLWEDLVYLWEDLLLYNCVQASVWKDLVHLWEDLLLDNSLVWLDDLVLVKHLLAVESWVHDLLGHDWDLLGDVDILVVEVEDWGCVGVVLGDQAGVCC